VSAVTYRPPNGAERGVGTVEAYARANASRHQGAQRSARRHASVVIRNVAWSIGTRLPSIDSLYASEPASTSAAMVDASSRSATRTAHRYHHRSETSAGSSRSIERGLAGMRPNLAEAWPDATRRRRPSRTESRTVRQHEQAKKTLLDTCPNRLARGALRSCSRWLHAATAVGPVAGWARVGGTGGWGSPGKQVV